jgi:hypothetical protein
MPLNRLAAQPKYLFTQSKSADPPLCSRHRLAGAPGQGAMAGGKEGEGSQGAETALQTATSCLG